MRNIISGKQFILFFLVVVFSFSSAFAQTRTISGTVKDENGENLVGATVAVKNSTVSTSTNSEGHFRISVPENAETLIISFIGKLTREVSIQGTSEVTVTLATNLKALTDVVVVGYGKSTRANLTTAQTSVSARQIDETVNTTVEQALQGRAAGVYVTQNSGQPGGGLSVNIRGISSLNRTQPLYVIDGIQIQSTEDVSYGSTSTSDPLSGINPSDIEDVEVLQGPSATAIYGSRGTNGVILITTKRGRAGDFRINYIYQYSLQTPPKNLPVMNLQQYAQMVNEYHTIAGGTTPGEFLDPSLLGAGTDWQKELFNNAAMNKHQL